MKDYSLNQEESKTFILNYEIDGEQIIVKRGSGKDFVIPYTKENEEKVLERMEEQVNDAQAFEIKQKKKVASSTIWAIVFSIWLAAAGIFLGTGNASMPIISWALAGLMAIGVGLNVGDVIEGKRVLKDLRKHKLFLNNEDIINQKAKENNNTLTGVKDSTKALFYDARESSASVNVNDAQNISYNDIRTMLDNIRADEEFDFDYKSLPKTRTRTRTKNKI